MVQKQVQLRNQTPDILITEKKEKEWKILDEELRQIVNDFHNNYDEFCAEGERVLKKGSERIISFEIYAVQPHHNQTEGFWMPAWCDDKGRRFQCLSMTSFRTMVSEYLLKFV